MTEDEPKREPPVMPTAEEAFLAGEDRTDAPGVVKAAYWMWIAAGVTGVVAAIMFLTQRSRLVADALRERPDLTRVELENTATGLSVWMLVGSTMFLGFFVLFAYKARGGTRKARTLLVTVGVFAALFQYALGQSWPPSLISSLLTVIALGMLYFPAARKYFAVSDER